MTFLAKEKSFYFLLTKKDNSYGEVASVASSATQMVEELIPPGQKFYLTDSKKVVERKSP
jgi:hypothetical protein